MSDDKRREAEDKAASARLTAAQKETARRLGISEKDYSAAAAELIRRGKLQRENIS